MSKKNVKKDQIIVDSELHRPYISVVYSMRLVMEKKFMTIDELSEYIGYTAGSIRNLVRQGKIPYRKPNGKLLFIVAEIDRWVMSARVVRNG